MNSALICIAAGAFMAVILFFALRRWDIATIRAELVAAYMEADRWQTEAYRWRREVEHLRLEAAEDKARLALFTMGGGR